MKTLNDIIWRKGEPMYIIPFNVWVKIIQPKAIHAMVNPPYKAD